MNKYIVTVQLGNNYYESGMYRCDDIVSAIDLACNDYHCVYKQVISVVRIEALF